MYLIVVYFGKFLSSKGHNSHRRKDDVITRTFSAFEQNIKSSTTRKLMCLDHIYTRHLNAQQAGVGPIYYSYHDMTYIFVDMQQLQ
jgi:hypothetical protein